MNYQQILQENEIHKQKLEQYKKSYPAYVNQRTFHIDEINKDGMITLCTVKEPKIRKKVSLSQFYIMFCVNECVVTNPSILKGKI